VAVKKTFFSKKIVWGSHCESQQCFEQKTFNSCRLGTGQETKNFLKFFWGVSFGFACRWQTKNN